MYTFVQAGINSATLSTLLHSVWLEVPLICITSEYTIYIYFDIQHLTLITSHVDSSGRLCPMDILEIVTTAFPEQHFDFQNHSRFFCWS